MRRGWKDTREKAVAVHRWNLLCLLLDTAAFGIIFKALSPNLTLTYYLTQFTTSEVLVGLVSVIGIGGQMLSQVFWAGLVTGRPRLKPLFVAGTVVSRGSIVLLLTSTLVWGRSNPAVSILAFFVAYGAYAISNGLLGVVWSTLIARTVTARRGQFLGLGYFLDGAIGLGVAVLVKRLLSTMAFPENFAWVLGLLSLIAIAGMLPAMFFQEERASGGVKSVPVTQFLWHRMTLLRNDPAYTGLLTVRVVVTLAEMGVPFYALHAVKSFSASTAHIGSLNVLLIASGAVATLVWGNLGDRCGFKSVLQSALFLGLTMVLLALSARSMWSFYVIFFLQGAYMSAIQMSTLNLNIELSPPGLTATYVGVANAITGVGLIVSPMAGAIVASRLGYSTLFAVSTAIYVVDLAFLTLVVRVPQGMAATRYEPGECRVT